jgi:uncharacterized damage-inducible protein DinB
MKLISPPNKNEYPEYAKMYIDLVPRDGLLLQQLHVNFLLTREMILPLPEETLLHSYAPGKWTIKEVLVHIIDDERIYAYRALSFARNENKPLPGFEQDEYAFYSEANNRTIQNIFEEYEAVRNATITLFNGMEETALMRSGIANNNKASVRALAYHIAGHELHHINIIREKYLLLAN